MRMRKRKMTCAIGEQTLRNIKRDRRLQWLLTLVIPVTEAGR
jgi:hypothetical protein